MKRKSKEEQLINKYKDSYKIEKIGNNNYLARKNKKGFYNTITKLESIKEEDINRLIIKDIKENGKPEV